MLALHARKACLLAISGSMLLVTACAEPDADTADDSAALEADAGGDDAGGDAKKDGQSDAMLEAAPADANDGGADAGEPHAFVTEVTLDDDRDDAKTGSFIDPTTVVRAGDWVRVSLPVTDLCAAWAVKGDVEIAATLIVADETAPDGTVKRRYTWKPSKPAVHNLQFVSGPLLLSKPLCSYSGVLIVN